MYTLEEYLKKMRGDSLQTPTSQRSWQHLVASLEFTSSIGKTNTPR